MRAAWSGRIGVVSLVGGLLLAGCGSGGDSPVAAQNSGVIDLSGVSPNWDKALPAAQRFVVLAVFNNEAVRDNNTGLVWERTPSTLGRTWTDANGSCVGKSIGGQKGWRLPAIPELASLIDTSVAPPDPTLPPGHPFLNVGAAEYWSATTRPNSDFAWNVLFLGGSVGRTETFNFYRAWCVRGGMSADQY